MRPKEGFVKKPECNKKILCYILVFYLGYEKIASAVDTFDCLRYSPFVDVSEQK